MLSVPTSAHGQLGGLRRAAQRVGGAAPAVPAAAQPAQASQPTSAASQVNRGGVLELTAPVLDRFGQAVAAYEADLAQQAQRLSSLKTPEQMAQCQLDFYNSEAGQAVYAKLNAAAESGDYARMTAVGEEVKTALTNACGDPEEGERIRSGASEHAQQAAIAAGGFTAREFALIQERIVPFCRAAASLPADGDVRLPGEGRDIFWVYTAAEAAALRERCGALMQDLETIS
jgi:hypothetical protein